MSAGFTTAQPDPLPVLIRDTLLDLAARDPELAERVALIIEQIIERHRRAIEDMVRAGGCND